MTSLPGLAVAVKGKGLFKLRLERDAPRLVGRDADDQHAVRVGNEDLAGEDGVAGAIGDFRHAGLHVQLAAVILGRLGPVERERQVAQGLEALLRGGNAPEVGIGHLLGFLELPGDDQRRGSGGST